MLEGPAAQKRAAIGIAGPLCPATTALTIALTSSGTSGRGADFRIVGLEQRSPDRDEVAGSSDDRLPNGIVCGVEVELTIGERTAPVTISWHYESEEAAPRLVTAYTSLYD